jgi:hypothetical protein
MRTIATLVLSLVLVACAKGAGGSPSGGIEGVVTAGPTCPVETLDSPCPPTPWQGTVRATASDGSTFEATTDADGRYRLALPAGSYEVAAVIEGGGPPTASPVPITIADAMQTLDLEVDTGIR